MVPGEDRQLVGCLSPLDGLLDFLQALELHVVSTFAHFVIGEGLELGGKAHQLEELDETACTSRSAT